MIFSVCFATNGGKCQLDLLDGLDSLDMLLQNLQKIQNIQNPNPLSHNGRDALLCVRSRGSVTLPSPIGHKPSAISHKRRLRRLLWPLEAIRDVASIHAEIFEIALLPLT